VTLNRSRGLNPVSAKRAAAADADGVQLFSTVRRTPFPAVNPVHTSRTDVAKVDRKPARRRYTGPDANTVDAILERDQHSCVVCGFGLVGVRGVDWSIHHRLRRSQGLDNSAPNLISVCGNGTQGCHGAIHARPKWAREFGGWLLRSTDDPATFPVLVERGVRRVLLTVDGAYATVVLGGAA